ncbi:hypothetical protein ABK046_42830 [Streptomyces caeruleatus]
MRRTVTKAATVLCTLAGLGLAGCGGDDGASGDGKASASASPSPNSSEALAAQYLAESQPIPFTSHRPAINELLALPPKWCAALKDGHSVDWTFSSGGGGLYPNGMDWGMVKKDAYRLLVAGVRTYCPDRLDTVTKELRETGEY